MTIKEITFTEFAVLSIKPCKPFLKKDWEGIETKLATKPNRYESYYYSDRFELYSKKLRTLGRNECVAVQKGQAIVAKYYQDVNNTRSTKYFQIIE